MYLLRSGQSFDTVSHVKLLETLEQIGFRGTCLNLLKNYLTNRTQCVNINDVISEFRTIEYGVPQGTVLGPILFNIYLNSLFSLPTEGILISFADDTAIFYTAESWEELMDKAQNDLKGIKNWFDTRLLTINFEKTKFVPFAIKKNRLPNLQPLKIACETRLIEIQPAREIKYLGITIDCLLKWDTHINNVIKKIRSLLPKFKYLRGFLDTIELKTVYYALVESQLKYGIIAWGGAYNTHIKNLENVQKWILKIIYRKNRNYSSEALFQLAKVANIRQLFAIALIIEQKNNKNKQPVFHKYPTRYKDKSVIVPNVGTTFVQRSSYFLGPRIYNQITPEIKNINSLKLFKKRVKDWLLSKPTSYTYRLIDLTHT